ncbi:hypothetical protein [Enterobacter sp. NFIX59]
MIIRYLSRKNSQVFLHCQHFFCGPCIRNEARKG